MKSISENIDQLYHLLRLVSNEGDSHLNASIIGLTKHLLDGGDYPGLLRFLQFYGETFLSDAVSSIIKEEDIRFERVVEIGAGFGWMSRGISARHGLLPCVLVDKRQWSSIDELIDLETEAGVNRLLSILKPNDLIVMSEFLHCISDPIKLMYKLEPWDKLIIEYMSVNKDFQESYDEQVSRYGCCSIDSGYMKMIFSPNIRRVENLEPYVLVYVQGNKQQEE